MRTLRFLRRIYVPPLFLCLSLHFVLNPASSPARLRAAEWPPSPALAAPEGLVYLPSDRRCVVVEKSSQTLFVFRSTPKGFAIEREFPCSTGARKGDKLTQGDEKTPEGIYLLKKEMRALPETYGGLAIALDYPNPFDRLEGKGGDGIWIHGTNEPFRPYLPNMTRGCIVLGNPELQQLSRLVTFDHTPLTIVQRLDYRPIAEKDADLVELRSLLDAWRQSWTTKDFEQHFSYYSSRFIHQVMDLAAWKKEREKEFVGPGQILVRINIDSILRHKKYAVLTFRQDFISTHVASSTRKRLFVERESGAWRIVAEEWGELRGSGLKS